MQTSIRFGFKIEKRDVWVGAFIDPHLKDIPKRLSVYFCPLPMCCFYWHITFLRKVRYNYSVRRK